jgi:hypothetical protein
MTPGKNLGLWHEKKEENYPKVIQNPMDFKNVIYSKFFFSFG